MLNQEDDLMEMQRDPAIEMKRRADMACEAWDFVVRRQATPAKIAEANAAVDVADADFALAVPSTPAGAREKLKCVLSALQCCEDGDELTANGAAELATHVRALLAWADSLAN
jgi:hypothetical protein